MLARATLGNASNAFPCTCASRKSLRACIYPLMHGRQQLDTRSLLKSERSITVKQKHTKSFDYHKQGNGLTRIRFVEIVLVVDVTGSDRFDNDRGSTTY